MGETAPDGLGPASESISEWWRGGSGSIEQQPLFALEVLKPLMQQDLERLSDQVSIGAGRSFLGVRWSVYLSKLERKRRSDNYVAI